MEYINLIKNWHRKASEQEDFFSAFVFEYLAFVAFLSAVKFAGIRLSDRAKIEGLKNDDSVKQPYLNKIETDSNLKKHWESIKIRLEQDAPIGNLRSGESDAVENRHWDLSEDDRYWSGVIYGLDDWSNMVELWYTVRNNLFHGSKNPEVERDKFFVEHCFVTLKPLVDYLIETLD